MSFARSSIRILARNPVGSSSSALSLATASAAMRLTPPARVATAAASLHTSRSAWLATPTSENSSSSITGPTQLGSHNHFTAPEGIEVPPGSQSALEAGQEPYPDYSKGPSAIDKAAQLFFFTEIFRGEWLLRPPAYSMCRSRSLTARARLFVATGMWSKC